MSRTIIHPTQIITNIKITLPATSTDSEKSAKKEKAAESRKLISKY